MFQLTLKLLKHVESLKLKSEKFLGQLPAC